MSRPLVTFAMLASLVSCKSSSPRDGDYAHPRDATLRMNQLQMLATHNSYHIRLTPAPIPDWNYEMSPLGTQLQEQGVRGLELDIHYVAEPAPDLQVYHLYSVDAGTTCLRFEDCLQQIKDFSDAHAGHHPIFVQIEPKDLSPAPSMQVAFDLIDEQIRNVFPEELLITPDFVQGEHASLREAITTQGWPTLAQVRGRVMFAFDCDRDVCLAYANGGTDLRGRVVFADSEPTDNFAAVMIANSPDDNARMLVQQGFFVRVFADGVSDLLEGEPDELAAALASGAQVITSDVVVPRSDISYVASIPTGTPSRCNPINAMTDCASTDIEDPTLLQGR